MSGEQPLTTWRAVAAAVGVSEDTLTRKRKQASNTAPAYFLGPTEARLWYRSLIGAPERPASPPPPSVPSPTKGLTLGDIRRRRGRN